MKSLWCPCIVYALMTCVSIVVAECSSGGPQSWSVWSILNGLFFLLSCILTFWVLLVIKSVIVLRKSKMHFDENGMLKECHSWYFFLHAAYHSSLRHCIPFSVSVIDFGGIDKNLVFEKVKDAKMSVLFELPECGNRISAARTVSKALMTFACMICTGISSAMTGIATIVCVSDDSMMLIAAIPGIEFGVIFYALFRLAIIHFNAASDVLIGRYTHARRILYCFLPLIPLGTMFAVRALKTLRTDTPCIKQSE